LYAFLMWLGRGTRAAHPISTTERRDSPWHRFAGVLV
jgi:hypothetical protein